MKITIDRERLLGKLNVISLAVATKSPLPVLTGILIDVNEYNADLTASNSIISIRTSLDKDALEIEKTGKVVVPGKMFVDIIKSLNAKSITLEYANSVLEIKAGRGKYKLRTLEAENYPEINFTVENASPISVEFKAFADLIKKVIFSCATSEKKPILTGVNLIHKDGVLTANATDSFRLSRSSMVMENGEDFNVTIPSANLNTLLKVGTENDVMDIIFNKNKLIVEVGTVKFVSNLLDAAYPDVTRLINNNFKISVEFNKEELTATVDRVNIMSPSDNARDKEISYNVLKMKTQGADTVNIATTNNIIGDANENLPLAKTLAENPNINLAFSGKHFLDALKSFKSETIKINYNGDLYPFIISSDTEPDLIQLILPVRV